MAVEMHGHHVVQNENRHIVCACGKEFGAPRAATSWRTHFLAEQRKVEMVQAEQIAEELGLSLPHDWIRDTDGSILCRELSDYHDGPECVRCGVVFCRNCYPEMWDGPCGEQTPYLI